MTLADATDTVGELLKAMKRAEAEGLDSSTLVKMLKDKSKTQ